MGGIWPGQTDRHGEFGILNHETGRTPGILTCGKHFPKIGKLTVTCIAGYLDFILNVGSTQP